MVRSFNSSVGPGELSELAEYRLGFSETYVVWRRTFGEHSRVLTLPQLPVRVSGFVVAVARLSLSWSQYHGVFGCLRCRTGATTGTVAGGSSRSTRSSTPAGLACRTGKLIRNNAVASMEVTRDCVKLPASRIHCGMVATTPARIT